MEYILFIHNNTDTPTKKEDWDLFFELARRSGLFQGGSEIGKRIVLGRKETTDTTKSVAGYMRFESEDIEALTNLLHEHPVLKSGGTLELCELPTT
jgi:hypothetical protein